jgi:aryl-alcohol dehydrogenase-like predicted oxidoreductase
VVKALKGSLDRLNQDSVTLYQIHWPGFPIINNWATNSFVDGLARVHRAGLAKAVGVSNFKAERVREVNSILADQGVPLATNQVQYSLLYRKPEQNGVLQACKDTQTTLIAYSPLTQGLLTGKYTLQNKPGGPRSGLFSDDRIRRIQPLLSLMRDIGSAHGGKSPAQVALNWVICKGALPICGVKNKQQAEDVAGVLGWRLSESEQEALERCSSVLQLDDIGAPFEQW